MKGGMWYGDRIEMSCDYSCGRAAGDWEGCIVQEAGLCTGDAGKRHSRMVSRFRRAGSWRLYHKNKKHKGGYGKCQQM